MATKRDLDALAIRVDRVDERLTEMDRRWDERLAGLDRRMQALERLPREFRSQLFALMSFMAVVLGVVVAAIKV